MGLVERFKDTFNPFTIANSQKPVIWEEITKILKNPSLVLQELNKQRRKNAPAAFKAEGILLENKIKQALKEERRYLHLYGQEKSGVV